MEEIAIGLTINKPIEDEELFKEAMAFCCDDSNNATMFEYHDKYVIGNKPIVEEELEPIEYVSIEDRLNDIEDALIELAEIIAGE